MMVKRLMPRLFATAVAILPLCGAAATPTVKLLLQDPSADAAAPGMVIKSDTATVKAGRVTFEAVNQSKSLVHEVLVIPAPAEGKALPYDAKGDTVAEKSVHSLGEIGDLKTGAHGKLTLKLKPGKYLLFCNAPGHYKAGMVTALTVEK